MENCIFEPRIDTSSATICKHCGQEKILHNHNVQLPQQEISDEEIEKGSKYIQTTNPDLWTFKIAWKAGAKWYREQLKSKGNERT